MTESKVFVARGGDTVASIVADNLARHPLAAGLYEWMGNQFSVQILGNRCVGSIVKTNEDKPLSQEQLNEQLSKVDTYRDRRSTLDAKDPYFFDNYQNLQREIFGFALRT